MSNEDKDNMVIYDSVKRPPPNVLRTIQKGRLKGKSDINPQWRVQVLTEQFGPVGIGWAYTIDKLWMETGNRIGENDNEMAAFAQIRLWYKHDGEWSEPVYGIGGSAFVTSETRGPHTSDECYKMAVTDAISVASKQLGVAADIYMGLWDGSKYITDPNSDGEDKKPPVNMQALRTPDGKQYIRKFKSANAVLAEIRKSRYVSEKDETEIKAIYNENTQ